MKALGKAIATVFTLAMTPAVYADVHDHIFANGLEIPADAPASTNEAARFLTQATFGPTQADITHLMAVGYNEWIEEQLGMKTTLSEPTVEAIVNARTAGAQNVGQTQRLNRWFWQATYAPDQLRQRMAFALSQILVVSDQASTISQDIVPMAHYQDLLANDGFGMYRTLLGDVTYNPTMGKYLNAFRNVKGNCSGVSPNIVCTTLPDENYAREIMQLFSVGLVELDMQNNVVLSAGQPIPTYDQGVISSTAKVFTGFTYSDAPLGTGANYTGANFYGGGATFATQYAPMVCWGTELYPDGNGNMKHDITGDDNSLHTPKTVLSWFVGGNLVTNTIASGQNCSVAPVSPPGQFADVEEELDIIAGHTNVAPFITRQLIQRFVTSNPSPAYIGRVTSVWQSSGGDLGDVLKAILMDTEARNPPALVSGDSYGKLREPILRVTAMWRAFNAKAQPADQYGEIAMNGGNNSLGNYGQGPYESPTVFNFYTPDYSQPGVFADNNLNSPEFQIVNESTIYTVTNSFYQLTAQSYIGVSPAQTSRPMVDLSSLTGVSDAQIVTNVNNMMLYGTMSSAMQTTLTNLVHTGLAGATPQEKAWSAIYMTMLSPEYATQR